MKRDYNTYEVEEYKTVESFHSADMLLLARNGGKEIRDKDDFGGA
jgi:hypothetical protein